MRSVIYLLAILLGSVVHFAHAEQEILSGRSLALRVIKSGSFCTSLEDMQVLLTAARTHDAAIRDTANMLLYSHERCMQISQSDPSIAVAELHAVVVRKAAELQNEKLDIVIVEVRLVYGKYRRPRAHEIVYVSDHPHVFIVMPHRQWRILFGDEL